MKTKKIKYYLLFTSIIIYRWFQKIAIFYSNIYINIFLLIQDNHRKIHRIAIYHIYYRLQQYVNRELPDVQAGFRKGTRATRDQIANIRWIMEKAREFQKNIHFCFLDYAKAFDCVDHNKLWKILKEMGPPDHLT